MSGKEQSAGEGDRRRRYRILLAVEAVLIVLSALLFPLVPSVAGLWAKWPAIILWTGLGLWHVVAIPICFFYLIGKPIVMTMRMNATRESAEFRDLLRERPSLTDDEFYARFYSGSEIPKQIPDRVRSILRTYDAWTDRILLTERDDLVLDDELGLGDAACEIEEEFGIHFTEADRKSADGTLGNLILLVHVRVSPQFQ